jgi:hypothetical protein
MSHDDAAYIFYELDVAFALGEMPRVADLLSVVHWLDGASTVWADRTIGLILNHMNGRKARTVVRYKACRVITATKPDPFPQRLVGHGPSKRRKYFHGLH